MYQSHVWGCVQLLVEGFNVAAADNVMCRDTVNVGWDGRIFDCDFNQQLDMGMRYALYQVFPVQNGLLDVTAQHACAKQPDSVCQAA